MRAHCASPCSNMGFHQKPAGSGGGGAAGAAPLVMSCAHDLAPSSSWRFHISKSCWDGDVSVMVHLWPRRRAGHRGKVGMARGNRYEEWAASQAETFGQQWAAAPRPAMSEMCPPGNSTYSLSRLPTRSTRARTQSGGAM